MKKISLVTPKDSPTPVKEQQTEGLKVTRSNGWMTRYYHAIAYIEVSMEPGKPASTGGMG